MNVSLFGQHDGLPVHRVVLAGAAGLRAAIIGFGASLQDLVVETANGPRRVVLGFPRLEDYLSQRGYFGAVVGRYGNRIAGGRFRLDERLVQLDLNENGRNHLHGGRAGFGRRVWSLVDHGLRHATFELVSADGDMGYPGRLVARASYRLEEPDRLAIRLEARAEAETPVNLVSHAYFNLAGHGHIRDHRLQVEAARVVETDADLIPTGRLIAVAGTPRDFRQARPIGETGIHHDICYVLDQPGMDRPCACLTAPAGDLSMRVFTTEPGLQVYDGLHVAGGPVGLDGRAYAASTGLCLEAQRFPDGPNHAHFPPSIVRAGETSVQEVAYAFAPA